MSTDDADFMARLARLEQMAGIEPNPTAVDDEGWPTHVVPGELIESAWGNAVVDGLTAGRDKDNKWVWHTYLGTTNASSQLILSQAQFAPGLDGPIQGWITGASTYGGSHWERSTALWGGDNNFYVIFEVMSNQVLSWSPHPNSPVQLFIMAWSGMTPPGIPAPTLTPRSLPGSDAGIIFP